MKRIIPILLIMCFAQYCMAQDNNLFFKNARVSSITMIDYDTEGMISSVLLQYQDSCGCRINIGNRTSNENTSVFRSALPHLARLLDEIGHSDNPSSVKLGVTDSILRKRLTKKRLLLKYSNLFLKPDREEWSIILNKYCSEKMFDMYLKNSFQAVDSGAIVVNTAHDWSCLRVEIQTDQKTYYFDMRDIDLLFQPYLMRCSTHDCLTNITNLNVNKCLADLFYTAKIHRHIPWIEDLIDSYVFWCAEDYAKECFSSACE